MDNASKVTSFAADNVRLPPALILPPSLYIEPEVEVRVMLPCMLLLELLLLLLIVLLLLSPIAVPLPIYPLLTKSPFEVIVRLFPAEMIPLFIDARVA